MKKHMVFFGFVFIAQVAISQLDTAFFSWKKEMVRCHYADSVFTFMSTQSLSEQCWNELAQPLFWKRIMTLPPDSCVINIGSSREIVAHFSLNAWNNLSDEQKDSYRDSIRKAKNLPESEHIYMTRGKNDFYLFDKVIPTLQEGIEAFANLGVDPWYAQAILLIESPGSLNKSSVGAFGAFQLMPNVARMFGLKVNKYMDERRNFERSAYASSQLIKTVCIPQAKRILDEFCVSYEPNDLWFRLFVMHIYHAGAYNVEKVVQEINPTQGGMDLITRMWQTKAGGFGNASQNYSQIALATLMVLSEQTSMLN